jgi:hypothetical protein
MDAGASTTYYSAILLRKRWREASSNERSGFDIGRELQRIQDQPQLISSEISRLERWSVDRG